LIYQQRLNKIASSMLGSAATEKIITEDGKVTLKKNKKHRRRLKELNKEFSQRKEHLKSLHGLCINHVQPVTCPLVLIS
jgi:hypothetical protein